MKREKENTEKTGRASAPVALRIRDQLTDGITDVFLKWDAGGSLIYTNERIKHYTGQSRKTYLQKDISNFNALGGDSQVWQKAFERCSVTGKSVLITKAYDSPVLGKLVFENVISPSINEERTLEGFTAICRDITEKIAERNRVERFSARYELILELSKNFISSPLKDSDALLIDSLEKIGTLLGADRAYIFTYDLAADTCSNSHEWCGKGINPQIESLQDVPLMHFPEFLHRHIDGMPYIVRETANLNPRSETSKLFRRQGIKTLIAVPIMNGSRCIGFTGVDFVKKSKDIDMEEVDLMELFAGLLFSLTEKLEALRKSENDAGENH